MSNDFRPNSWNEYIGQEKIIKNLKIYIEAAVKQNRVLDPIIFSGPSGMGKTSLAYLLSKILKTKIHIVNGPSLQKPSDLISILTSIKEKQILFIDEIHSVSKEIMEVLYPVLEENKLSIIIGKEYNSKIVNIKLPNFSIITATTEINRLPFPFLNRFPIQFELEGYNQQDLIKIITNTFKKLNDITIETKEAEVIARYSKLVPRVANNLVKRIYDFLITEKIKDLSEKSLEYVFNQMGLYEFGLNEKDIDYLKALKENITLSLDSLAQIINVPSQTILNNIEPIFLKEKLIIKTGRGRQITNRGKDYLEKNKKTIYLS
ncbi:Holliday junction branch migration DNA helicase RuvB [Mesoplasma chauliocola]|uniref:Holliday junction branch migration complex subunit RuvB n=1 Tax=Mesoplasma chauliocola TaxID=216427 RepID=A0A249SNX8_9MOLU|nr:Holliday junction branch migration DNA helicase RuvB [Mesoplasma chauliocola]ASZ09191.1 Holliday junction branch migration DNA helicase RuvB [Mesoplasma chauliocola]